MKKGDEPAYPIMGIAPEDGSPIEYHGLTKRERIAIAAMQALIADSYDEKGISKKAFAIADAMIEEGL